MNSRVRSGLEAWAAAQDAQQPEGQEKRKQHRRFGLRYVDSPSAGLRYKILTYVFVCLFVVSRWLSDDHVIDITPTPKPTPNQHRLEDGFPLTAVQPTNITEKSTCYSYVGMPPKRKARHM